MRKLKGILSESFKRVHRSKLNLFQGKATAREMWLTLQKEFDIIRAAEIGTIALSVMSKLFQDYESVDSYCQAYQDAYNEIASRLANNNGDYNQDKHYEVLLQGAMLERLPEAYASLVATIDTEWANYTQADLQGTIYRISRFLKTDPLKILHATSVPRSSNSNKRPRLATEIPVCPHPICASRGSRHPVESCWELYPELRPSNRRAKAKQAAELKIKGTAATNNTKTETPKFNLS